MLGNRPSAQETLDMESLAQQFSLPSLTRAQQQSLSQLCSRGY